MSYRRKVNLEHSQGADALAAVMVVEDDFWIRIAISDELRSAGYKVVECGTADEAIDFLRSGDEVGAVFTDVQMPGALDGVDLAKLVEREFADIAVLVTSAAHLREALSAPFLPKPYEYARVIEWVRSSLKEAR